MAQQSINIGSGPNTKDGDPIREAFRKTDENFTELYNGYIGSAVGNGYTGSAGSVGYTGSQGTIGFTGSVGAGYTGSKGDQGPAGGYTGSRGDTGYIGSQGYTGNLGYSGSAGFTGSQGEIGYTGSGGSGYTGSKGDTGNFGGASFTFRYSIITTDTDPGNGWVQFNNDTLSSATIIRISYHDFDDVNIYNFLQTVDDSTSSIKGHFSASSKYNFSGIAMFAITGSHIEKLNYFDIPINWLSGPISFTDQTDIVISFARTGDIGDIGYTGSRGYTGSSSIPLGTKTSNSIGTPGDTSYDTNYFYICVGTNSWKRIALVTIT